MDPRHKSHGQAELKRFRLKLAYDGTAFVGSQRQARGRTVQAEVEKALSSLHEQSFQLDLAGRTDSGVHALGMVAAYTVETWLTPVKVRRALNARLPPDVRVVGCELVPQGFHPRFDAKSKTYCYRLWVAPEAHPLLLRNTWHVTPGLDRKAMAAACELLLGEHDFGAFRSKGSGEGHAVRRMLVSRLRCRGRLFILEFEGTGFLRHQVRAMVGTLMDVGRGQMSLSEFSRLLETGRREDAGATVPPHGLILIRIRY
jgi:tRNA pseudouridine38-40 synthase